MVTIKLNAYTTFTYVEQVGLDMLEGKGKVMSVIDQAPRHKDVWMDVTGQLLTSTVFLWE
jgi:hypothetical protein